MDYKTLFLILGAVLLVVMFFLLFGKRSKKSIKNSKITAILGVALLVLGIIPFLGVASYGSGQLNLNPQAGSVGAGDTNGVTGDVVDTTVDIRGCDLSATITYTLAAQDTYNGSATGGTHRYRLDGGTWQTLSDAGTFSGSPYQKLDVLWENGATTGYFSKFESYTLPCSVKTFSPKLSFNGTITSVEKDDAGTVIAVASNNQTLAAGDVLTSEITLKGTYERDYPYGFDAVVDWNTTDIDNIKLLDKSGNEYALGVEPQSHTDIYSSSVGAKKTYYLPGLYSTQNLVFDVLIDADDTNNPAAQGSCGNNITITYYPRNLFVDDNNGGIAGGPASQDEDQTLTRASAGLTSTICYD